MTTSSAAILRVTTSDTGGQPGTIYVDGSPRDDWGIWPDLEPGTYQVCFGPVPDYLAACLPERHRERRPDDDG